MCFVLNCTTVQSLIWLSQLSAMSSLPVNDDWRVLSQLLSVYKWYVDQSVWPFLQQSTPTNGKEIWINSDKITVSLKLEPITYNGVRRDCVVFRDLYVGLLKRDTQKSSYLEKQLYYYTEFEVRENWKRKKRDQVVFLLIMAVGLLSENKDMLKLFYNSWGTQVWIVITNNKKSLHHHICSILNID